MALELRYDDLIAKVERAAADAIDETTGAAAEMATRIHPWVSRTGNLERQTIHEPARREGSRITGRFGFAYAGGEPGKRDAFYGLFQEVGTSRQAARPALRPAADAEFPHLADRIRRRLK